MSYSSANKVCIRETWSKPLLKFLHKKLNSKLIYLGLPSQYAEDIEEWFEYINEVIAFQCRKYPKPSTDNQSRECIIELETKLLSYKRQGKIDDFVVYDGYIEEVILRGNDNVDKKFLQPNAINVYNLDFCNAVTSPISYIDENGKPKSAYKLEVIKKISEYQSNSMGQKIFVLFLTIQATYRGEELVNFIANADTTSEQQLIDSYNSLGRNMNKKIRILRLFIIKKLQEFLRHYKFIPHFLPTIKYNGLGRAKLLHFTVLAIKETQELAGDTRWLQNIDNLCMEKFIKPAGNTDFECIDCSNINEQTINNINSVTLFSISKTYEKTWV